MFLRQHLKPLLLALIVVALIFLLISASCSNKKESHFQGYVEGEFVYVASPYAGRLDQLFVKRGQSIAQKTHLFVLEHGEEQASYQQAEETLNAALSDWDDLKKGKRQPELDVVRAQVGQATANEKLSAIQLKRDQEQFAAGGISKQQLDNSRFQHDSDVAKLKEMQSQLVSSELPARDDQILAQAFQVAAAKASVAQTKWRLDQKSVYAIRHGLVFDTLYRVGDWVPAGGPVIQMLPPENIKVRFFVPQTALGHLQLDQAVQIHYDGAKSVVDARITYISAQAEYTPPVIYSNETRSKLIYMIEAHPTVDKAPLLHPGQPVEVIVL